MKTYSEGRYVPASRSDGEKLFKDQNLDRLVRIHWIEAKNKLDGVRQRLAALQGISSPYLALIYDLVVDGDEIGVVEEYLSEPVKITRKNQLLTLYQFCSGLASLHEHELAHGALKVDCFRSHQAGPGRLCNLAFGESKLTPATDSEAFASQLVTMGADQVDDSTFQKIRKRINADVSSHVTADLRNRLAALILHDRHRALANWRGKSAELGPKHPSARFVHPIQGVAIVKIEYDGTRFFLSEVQGEVKVNNLDLPVGSDLPHSCVIVLGDSSRPYSQRYSITFDQSHPEVM